MFEHVRGKHEVVTRVLKGQALQIDVVIDAGHVEIGRLVFAETVGKELGEERLGREVQHSHRCRVDLGEHVLEDQKLKSVAFRRTTLGAPRVISQAGGRLDVHERPVVAADRALEGLLAAAGEPELGGGEFFLCLSCACDQLH